jgi:hypothetical protein
MKLYQLFAGASKAGHYSVHELKTGLLVKTIDKRSVALRLTTLLNKGCGFEGQTPTFFVPVEDRKYAIR